MNYRLILAFHIGINKQAIPDDVVHLAVAQSDKFSFVYIQITVSKRLNHNYLHYSQFIFGKFR